MKRFHELFHFRNENGDITGAYIQDREKGDGRPVEMSEFEELVQDSQVMFLEWEDNEMVHKINAEEKEVLGKAGKVLCRGMQEYWENDSWVEAANYSLFNVGFIPSLVMPIVKMPIVGEILMVTMHSDRAALQKIKEVLTDLKIPSMARNFFGFDGLVISMPATMIEMWELLVAALPHCIFCWPPVDQTVTNTENIRKASLFNKVLRTEVRQDIPPELLDLFRSKNEWRLNNYREQADAASAQITEKMNMF